MQVVALVTFGIAMWIMWGVEGNKCERCEKVAGGEPINCEPLFDDMSPIDDDDEGGRPIVVP